MLYEIPGARYDPVQPPGTKEPMPSKNDNNELKTNSGCVS